MPNVKIRIESGSEVAGDGRENQEDKKALEERNKEQAAMMSKMAQQMLGTTKQVISYRVSNVGLFSGNYIKQDQVNAAMELLTDATTIGMGFASGGWLGASIAVVGLATKVIMEQISGARADLANQRATDYLLARSGNATKNGSRGTDN